MAAITSLAALPDNAGVLTSGNLAAILAALTAQNTNNTNINAQLAVLAAQLGTMASYRATYSFAVDAGGIGLITPVTNQTIPTNFVITEAALNSTTAVTSAGAATVAVGLSAGSSGGAAALVAATGKATWILNAQVGAIPVPQTPSTWIKMTAPGTLTITVAAAALTAGIIEITVFGYQSPS